MNLERLDPRIKLVLLIFLSTAAVFTGGPAALSALFVLSSIILIAGGVKPGAIWVKLRGFFGLIVSLFIIQCLFNRIGDPMLSISGITLVTDAGFYTAVSVSLRLFIIALGALIVQTGRARDCLLALTQCKVPYEIAFTVLAALRFLPMLREEAMDVLCAARMRGLRVKKTGLKTRASAYISLILPVTAGAINRAEQMSIAMETRAFRAYPRRTNYRRLRMRAADMIYFILFCAVLAAIIILFN